MEALPGTVGRFTSWKCSPSVAVHDLDRDVRHSEDCASWMIDNDLSKALGHCIGWTRLGLAGLSGQDS
jgi:hypothetical protein